MKPNFSGEFVLDRPACALDANASAFTSARLLIEHDDPRFRCSASFATSANVFEFTFVRFTDGRESVIGAPHERTRCYWEHDVLVSEDREGTPEAPVVMTWRYELDAGGRRLRATERIRGGGRDQDNVWEFERP